MRVYIKIPALLLVISIILNCGFLSSFAKETGVEYIITASSLNVRKAPSTDSEKVATVYAGERYTVTKISNGKWGKIGENRWISLDYAEKATQKIYSISKAGIDFIKKYEGYSKYKYWDYSQYTIGYGSRCEENDYPNGITEPQAAELLRTVIVKYEAFVDSFASKYNITLNQAQYDALVSVSYNCGNIWVVSGKGDSLKKILIDGAEKHSNSEIIAAFKETCIHAGGVVLQGLINRRAGEAVLFLSGWGSCYYDDVKNGSWYNECVGYCTRLNYVSGMGNRIFSPNGVLTREQLVTILYRYSGKSGYNGYTNFYDVGSKKWYAPAIHWASECGVTSGISKDYFGVGVEVTREMLVTMMYNFAKHIGVNISAGKSYSKYADAKKVATWAAPSVEWALEKGIIVGTSAVTLSPKDTATRAATAMIFNNFDKKVLGIYQ